MVLSNIKRPNPLSFSIVFGKVHTTNPRPMNRFLSLAALFTLATTQAQVPFCTGETFGTMPSILSYSCDLVSYQGSIYAIHAATPLALSKYDPSTGTVSALAPPSFFLAESSLARHGDKLYVFGGWTGSSPSNTAHVYDIVSNSWQTLPNMPVSITETSAIALGDDIYITGGTLGVTVQHFIRYNVPSNSYSILASPSSYANSKLLHYNGSVYCFGGHRYNGNSMETSDLFKEYDPISNTWQGLTNMPFARTKVGATIWGDYLYIFGGHTCTGGVFASYTPEDDYFVYDFATSQWVVSPNVTPVLGAQACISMGDTIYTTNLWKYFCASPNVGVAEPLPLKPQLRVFPNPGTGAFMLEFTLSGKVDLRVFDVTGRQVHNEVLQGNSSKTQRTLDLSQLAKGGYSVQVGNAGAMVTQQVIIE